MGDDGAYGAAARGGYTDLEANKPLRGAARQGGYQSGGAGSNDFVPTAEAVGAAGWGENDVPVAQALADYDVAVRHGFLRKVFGILGVQLLVTFGWVLLCSYHEGTRTYMQVNTWPIVVGITMSFVALFGMVCFIDMARSYPQNYVLLGLFTLAESLMLGAVSAQSNPGAISLAVGITAAVVLALVGFAMQTRHDFTGMGPYLWVGLMTMIMYSLVAGLFGIPTGGAYSLLGALLFSFYIVYDVQLVVGGKNRQLQIGVDDYCFAALNIYLDIINLFLYILDMVNRSQR